jgi:hypothetical protein
MARIELRHCTVRLEDGLAGTASNNQPVTPPISGDTSLTINTVSLNTDVTDKVPLGARFTIAGEGAATVHVVTARTPTSVGPTTAITFTPALGTGTYTSAAAGIAGAATTSVQGSGGGNEVQSIARHVNNVTGGTFTLTLTINGGGPVTTAAIAYNAIAATIQSAIDLVSGVTAGHIVVTGGPLTTTAITITFSGADVDLTNQGQTTINGASLTASIGNKTLTFTSQQLDIKIGDGDLKYTENDDFKYDLDRGNLDTVRQGDEKPMDVSLSFVYEHITTGTGETIAPMDALKRRGGAAEWVSSATDLCEPYAVDLSVIHTPPCGTAQTETTLFPDFRSDKREPSLKDSLIQITGRCNATEPTVSRG